MSTRPVLFLCTGNYFRSRYAECLFNALAAERGLAVRADSRGLAVERGTRNVGPMARAAVARLAARGIAGPALTRMPAQVTAEELRAAARIIAVKESEHRVLVEQRYPEFRDRVEYWHVDDIDCCTADEALDRLEALLDDCLMNHP